MWAQGQVAHSHSLASRSASWPGPGATPPAARTHPRVPHLLVSSQAPLLVENLLGLCGATCKLLQALSPKRAIKRPRTYTAVAYYYARSGRMPASKPKNLPSRWYCWL